MRRPAEARAGGLPVAADDPCDRGLAALRGLVAGLPHLVHLHLHDSLCAAAWVALSGAADEAGAGAGSGALRGLRLLRLDCSLCSLEECRLGGLRRLMQRAHSLLHVLLEQRGSCRVRHDGLPAKALILPHSAGAHCRDCPAEPKTDYSYCRVYIGDCKSSRTG